MPEQVIQDPKTHVKPPPPPELRTYHVLCDTCAYAPYYNGVHEADSANDKAAREKAERITDSHTQLFPGHHTFLLMHTQNALLREGVL